mmetsp:Transcript_33592/g.101185  ORF Transcript_33592/g.101185 Transcript_33592/m.101185 type:complete len:246 (+) Transcript_33592:92-829(+)
MALASSRTSSGRLSCRVEDVERVAVRVGHHAMREGRARVQGRRARVVGGRRPLTRAVGIEVAVGPAHVDGAVAGEGRRAPVRRQAGAPLAVLRDPPEDALLVARGGLPAVGRELCAPALLAGVGVQGDNGSGQVGVADGLSLLLLQLQGLRVDNFFHLGRSIQGYGHTHEGACGHHKGAAVAGHHRPGVAGVVQLALPEEAAAREAELAQHAPLALHSTGSPGVAAGVRAAVGAEDHAAVGKGLG